MASGRWVVHDEINVLTEQNQAVVRAELVFPNVVFGLHRWYAGGSSPSRVVLATPEEWEAELSRGRPGDNLMLVSLRKVTHLALAHLGSPMSADPPITPDSVQERLLLFLEDESNELAVVHRYVLHNEHVECSYDTVWDPSADDWADDLDRWSRLKGELFFFDDAKVVWAKAEPCPVYAPESRTGQRGYYLIDGYLPDADGRIVIGGAY